MGATEKEHGMSEDKELTFEEALTKLEQIVQAMESGELSLEQSMKHFEEGMALSRLCGAKLTETEQKIEMLVQKAEGAAEWAPVAPAGDEE
jgi:exodeoxyribonuclease VII small subunit